MATTADDIVAVGGTLEPNSVLAAYRRGVFPWPCEGLPLLWFCPRQRAVLDFARLHIGRSLKRARRQSSLRFTIDAAFGQVIRACAAAPRGDQEGTWITPEVIACYEQLHRLGHAHSAEAWLGDELVGGIYGIDAGGAFSGESMFHRQPNASKLALLHLVEHLASSGADWIDVQVMTPHVERLGARLIPRRMFLARLAEALRDGALLFA